VRKAFRLFLCSSIFCVANALANSNSPTNFQFASLPVPYPKFTVGSVDASFGGSYITQTAGTADLKGYAGDLKLRLAPWDALAVGFQLPGSHSTGDLGDDYGTLDLSLTTYAPAANFQLQAVRSSAFSALLFAGYTYNSMTAKIGGSTQGVAISGKLTLTSSEFPMGIQLGIRPFGDLIEIAPFYTYTKNLGGTASMTTNSGGNVTSSSEKIPGFTSRNYGFDVILPKNLLSIGALIQQTMAAQSNEKNMKTFKLGLSLLFGSIQRGRGPGQ
jgi:hypothetical protein